MKRLTINLSEETAAQLKAASKKAGVKPEDFLLVSLREKLANIDPEFTEVLRYVMKKNADLYRRLS